MSPGHELRRVGATRGEAGRRTVFYGYCECGHGIGASVNAASVKRKHRKHLEQTEPTPTEMPRERKQQ